MKRRALMWGVPLVIIAGVLATWTFRRENGPRVDVVRPTRGPLVQTLVTSGRVIQQGQSELGAQIQSTVVEVAVEEGASVEADALLVRLADDEAQAALAEAEAAVAEAEARFNRVGVGRRMAAQSLQQARIDAEQAASELARQEALHASGAISEAALERARRDRDATRSRRIAASLDVAAAAPRGSDAQAAAAALARAQARLRSAEIGVRRTQIRAPSAGAVLDRHVETGEVVRPGEVLITFAGEGPLEVRVRPDESNLARLEVGQHALVSPEAFPDREPVEAEVVRIAPSVDPSSGTIEVELTLADAADLRPDMTVSVEIEVGRREEAIVLPVSTIRDLGGDRPWVLVAREGVAVRQDVSLGLEGDDRVEVLEGLDVDDAVIPPTSTVGEDEPVRIRRVEPAS